MKIDSVSVGIEGPLPTHCCYKRGGSYRHKADIRLTVLVGATEARSDRRAGEGLLDRSGTCARATVERLAPALAVAATRWRRSRAYESSSFPSLTVSSRQFVTRV
jgi:hypothetical protein